MKGNGPLSGPGAFPTDRTHWRARVTRVRQLRPITPKEAYQETPVNHEQREFNEQRELAVQPPAAARIAVREPGEGTTPLGEERATATEAELDERPETNRENAILENVMLKVTVTDTLYFEAGGYGIAIILVWMAAILTWMKIF